MTVYSKCRMREMMKFCDAWGARAAISHRGMWGFGNIVLLPKAMTQAMIYRNDFWSLFNGSCFFAG
jgi:hypothetical protein